MYLHLYFHYLNIHLTSHQTIYASFFNYLHNNTFITHISFTLLLLLIFTLSTFIFHYLCLLIHHNASISLPSPRPCSCHLLHYDFHSTSSQLSCCNDSYLRFLCSIRVEDVLWLRGGRHHSLVLHHLHHRASKGEYTQCYRCFVP